MTIGSTNPDNRGIDALLPAEIAEKAEAIGVQKTKLPASSDDLIEVARAPRGEGSRIE